MSSWPFVNGRVKRNYEFEALVRAFSFMTSVASTHKSAGWIYFENLFHFLLIKYLDELYAVLSVENKPEIELILKILKSGRF